MIDVDDFLAQWRKEFLKFANKKYGTNFLWKDADNWDFPTQSPNIIKKATERGLGSEWFGVTYIEQVRSHELRYLSPVPGSIEAITDLYSNGWKLTVVTDRISSLTKHNVNGLITELEKDELKKIIIDDTHIWFESRFGKEIFSAENIKFTNGEPKYKLCERLDIRILGEDSYRNSYQHASNPNQIKKNYSLLIDNVYNQGPDTNGLIRITARDYEEKFDVFKTIVERLSKLN